MRRATVAVPLLLLSGIAFAQDPCAALAVQSATAGAAATSLSPELASPRHQLGAPSGVLAQAADEAASADSVLLRMRVENCQSVAAGKKKASSTPSTSSTAAASTAPIDPSTYKPLTKYDNTPYRFDMNQNGKRMTAEEFDKWMKARGVRVATGKPATTPAPEAKKED